MGWGFRDGAWMNVFEIRPTSSQAVAQIRGTISSKKAGTDGSSPSDWETDFGGWCSCVGGEVAQKILGASPQPTAGHPIKIHLGNTGVKQKGVQNPDGTWTNYTNFNIYSFDFGDGMPGNSQQPHQTAPSQSYDDQLNVAYEGISDDVNDEGLPF